jgi:glycerate 2-kinase
MARRVTVAEQLGGAARAAIAACGGERLVADAIASARADASARGSASARGDASSRVWAVGKAACAMARGAAGALGDELAGGLVITKARDPAHADAMHAGSTGAIEPRPRPRPRPRLRVLEAAHPVPDERGVAATHALLAEAAQLAPDGRAWLLLSGGTSALLAGTVAGVTLDELRAATRALLAGGASIDEINVVRRHLGAALGGRLLAATRGAIDVLALSDVVGDDPAAIGSGPASADATTVDDARAIAARYGLEPLAFAETLKPTDAAAARATFRVLASPAALAAAGADALRAAGFAPRMRATLVTGALDAFAAELAAHAAALAPGEAFVAAGEPTLIVRGAGAGGRAQHLAFLVARALRGRGADVGFVACGSDGTDGPTSAAGAAVDGTTWDDCLRRGLEPDAALTRCDSHTLARAAGCVITTGPTGTNLTDLFLLARSA